MIQNVLLEEVKNFASDGEYTSQEILGQPDLWSKVFESVSQNASEISEFFRAVFKSKNIHIILTGAGTSAFIGDVLEGIFQKKTRLLTKAIPTTDLVTHPELYFQSDKDVLLISFARSGNSPESAKAIQLANQISKNAYNLVITCNRQSELVDTLKDSKKLIVFLPPEADDKSLAMTGSFTSMLLTGLLVSEFDNIAKKENEIELLKNYAKKIFENYLSDLSKVTNLDFDRAIFLGSGPLKGTARESQLKVQELTDGKIICKYDSFLGFRHGPKAVINDETLVTYLFTNNSYANKYEIDLVNAVNKGRKPLYTIGVMESKIEGIELNLDIIYGDGKSRLSEEFLSIVSVIPAQIIGFIKSARFGLKPDNPSESGMIHRVVQGVNLYPYESAANK